MSNKVDIIIIRGAPGAGKSQVAKSLSQFFPKGVRVEVDTIRQMVISVDWKNQQEHINMLQASAKLVLEFLHFGFAPVIVVDTFSGDKINGYLDTLYAQDKNLAVRIFGLYTTDEELKRRLDMRTGKEFNDFPICKKLNDDVLKWKHNSEFQVDTTGLMPKQTAERIYGRINTQSLYCLYLKTKT
jgi:RNase adaptor protein for sRNA GlmZ degradation